MSVWWQIQCLVWLQGQRFKVWESNRFEFKSSLNGLLAMQPFRKQLYFSFFICKMGMDWQSFFFLSWDKNLDNVCKVLVLFLGHSKNTVAVIMILTISLLIKLLRVIRIMEGLGKECVLRGSKLQGIVWCQVKRQRSDSNKMEYWGGY